MTYPPPPLFFHFHFFILCLHNAVLCAIVLFMRRVPNSFELKLRRFGLLGQFQRRVVELGGEGLDGIGALAQAMGEFEAAMGDADAGLAMRETKGGADWQKGLKNGMGVAERRGLALKWLQEILGNGVSLRFQELAQRASEQAWFSKTVFVWAVDELRVLKVRKERMGPFWCTLPETGAEGESLVQGIRVEPEACMLPPKRGGRGEAVVESDEALAAEYRTAVIWVARNLHRKVGRASAPSAMAWNLLAWARAGGRETGQFMTGTLAKLVKVGGESGGDERFKDDGASVVRLIERLQQVRAASEAAAARKGAE